MWLLYSDTTTFLNSIASRGPNVQTHKSTGHISHSNCNIQTLAQKTQDHLIIQNTFSLISQVPIVLTIPDSIQKFKVQVSSATQSNLLTVISYKIKLNKNHRDYILLLYNLGITKQIWPKQSRVLIGKLKSRAPYSASGNSDGIIWTLKGLGNPGTSV